MASMVNDYGDSQRQNLLPPLHGLLVSIRSKKYFICTVPYHVVIPVVEHSLGSGSTMRDRSDDPSHHELTDSQ